MTVPLPMISLSFQRRDFITEPLTGAFHNTIVELDNRGVDLSSDLVIKVRNHGEILTIEVWRDTEDRA